MFYYSSINKWMQKFNKKYCFTHTLAAIIFIVNNGVLGYISFVYDLLCSIFRIGLLSLTGLFASLILSITTLNFCFVFGLFDFLITSLHLLISNDWPSFALRFWSSKKLLKSFCSNCLFFMFNIFNKLL